MRLLGFLGIVALLPINIFGFVNAWQTRSLRGAALMLFMAGLLFLCARTLWRGARLEHGQTQGRLAEGWAGASVGAFFRGVVATTVEGRIYLLGALLSLVFAALALLWPDAIGITRVKASLHAVLFGLWPIVSFTVYVKLCGPTFQSSALQAVFVFITAAFPFYLAYR